MNRWAAVPALVMSLLAPASALAERASLTLLPVSTPSSKSDAAAPPADAERALANKAEILADVLADAAYDQGFDLARPQPAAPSTPDDDWLVEHAQRGWVLSPRIEASGSKVVVRLVAVAPGSRVLLVRSERMDANLIEVRAVVMLRDLLGASQNPVPPGRAQDDVPAPRGARETAAPFSAGRAVLALNAAVFGGYIGFSLQKASGSDDERLIYPLAALGAGIGLGASLLVADEWDVGVGDAWFVTAGGMWPAVGGLLLAQSYEVASEDRYVYGIVGASAGIITATAALAAKPMSDSGAAIAHSGGVFGLGLGGLGELLVRGDTDETPVRGMGFGAIGGVLVGGTLATQVDVPTSRVLLIDLGASLGALSGAAAASPLLIVEEEAHPTRTRLWLGSIAVGTLAGGTVAWWLTREAPAAAMLPFSPYAHAWPDDEGNASGELGITGRF